MLLAPALVQARGGLASQISRLARTERFTVSGIERLGNAPAKTVRRGSTIERVQTLLSDFNYAMIHRLDGRIKEVVIGGAKHNTPLASNPASTRRHRTPPTRHQTSSRRTPYPHTQQSTSTTTDSSSGEVVLSTQRDGGYHIVNGMVVGAEGQRISVQLLVDTKAAFTVLPIALATSLGINTSGLPARRVGSSQGQISARLGVIPTLELGTAQITGLETAFAQTNIANGRGILGMNLLSRYLFILDDETNELTLIPSSR